MHEDACKIILCGGNLILTDNGILPVSMVSKDNVILSTNGDRLPILSKKTLAAKPGHRRISTVSFDQGAFDQQCPRQLVSIPAQATMKLAGALLKAAQIVNSATVKDDSMDAANIYALELAGSGDIDVSGLTMVARHSYFDVDTTPSTAILNIRQHLLRRALQNGWQYIEDTSVQVSVENAIITPSTDNNIFIFRKPQNCFQIHSRSAIVAEQNPQSDDRRRLGILIAGIQADGRYIPIDAGYFGAGFHNLERSGKQLFRWTNGSSTLLLPFSILNLQIIVGAGLRILEKT